MLDQALTASRKVVLTSVGGELPVELQPSLTKGRIAALRAHLTSCAKTALKKWDGVQTYSSIDAKPTAHSAGIIELTKKETALAVHAVSLQARAIYEAEDTTGPTNNNLYHLCKKSSTELFDHLFKRIDRQQYDALKLSWEDRITAMADDARSLFLDGGNKRGAGRTKRTGGTNPYEPEVVVVAKSQPLAQSLLAPALRPLRFELASSIYERLVDTLISAESPSSLLAPRGAKISAGISHVGTQISSELQDELARYKQMIDHEFCMDLWKLDTALDSLAKSSASRHNAPDMPPALQQAIDNFFPALELVMPGNNSSAIGKFDPYYRLAIDVERASAAEDSVASILITDLSEFKAALDYFQARAKVKD